MKNVKLISLGISMFVCFLAVAQEKTISKDTIRNSKISSNSIDAILANKIIICAPSNKSLIKEPLYISDGKILNTKEFSKINPNDIENIKILKGIEATSIYGNQAVNGVIVITIKKED